VHEAGSGRRAASTLALLYRAGARAARGEGEAGLEAKPKARPDDGAELRAGQYYLSAPRRFFSDPHDCWSAGPLGEGPPVGWEPNSTVSCAVEGEIPHSAAWFSQGRINASWVWFKAEGTFPSVELGIRVDCTFHAGELDCRADLQWTRVELEHCHTIGCGFGTEPGRVVQRSIINRANLKIRS
jgi:hypothetical protein